jgi:L-ribulose-5-phosphate 3-epimerase
MLKGINQWCFPEGTPLEHIFSTCQKAGIDAVELNVYAPGEVGLTMDTTASEAEAIGALARKHDIQLRSLSTGLLGKYLLSDDDASVREQGRRVIKKQLELANVLGIESILVIPGRVSEKYSYDIVYKRSQEELSKVIPDAESHKVTLAVENIWNMFLLSPLEFARYIDELNSPYVGAYFDVGNVLLYAYPQQWIRILGKRISRVHVKDFKTGVGNYHGFVNLLSGDVNWSEVRTALNEIGYADTLVAELTAYASTPDQLIYDTARHLDFIIGREPR